MLFLKYFKTNLNYKNKETLYVLFFLGLIGEIANLGGKIKNITYNLTLLDFIAFCSFSSGSLLSLSQLPVITSKKHLLFK